MGISEPAKLGWREFEDLRRTANIGRHYSEIIDTHLLPGIGDITLREAGISTGTEEGRD